MNWFQYWKWKRRSRKIFNDLCKYYKCEELSELRFIENKTGCEGIYHRKTDLGGALVSASIKIGVKNLNKLCTADILWMKEAGINPFKFTYIEFITKTLLHEIRHHQQHNIGFKMVNKTIEYPEDHFTLPQEKDANRFTKKEWKRWKKLEKKYLG